MNLPKIKCAQIISLLCFLPLAFLSQNPAEKQLLLDTIKVYDVSYGLRQVDDSITYLINDAPVTKTELDRVAKQALERKRCNPCLLQKIDLQGKVLSQGSFYYVCPGKDEKIELNSNEEGRSQTYIKDNSCYDGEWLYYSKEGTLIQIKYFDHGFEIKEWERKLQ